MSRTAHLIITVTISGLIYVVLRRNLTSTLCVTSGDVYRERIRVQRTLSIATILTLLLQMVPVNVPPPSEVAVSLISKAPAPLNTAAPFLSKAVAPLDALIPPFSNVQSIFANPTAGITITKSAPAFVYQGLGGIPARIPYAITLTNPSGHTIGTRARITDSLPLSTTLIGGAPAPPWQYGTLPGGDPYFENSASIATTSNVGGFYVDVDSPIQDRTVITNHTYCFTGTVDAVPTQFCESTPITTEVRAPDFSLTESWDSASGVVCAGQRLTYTISISNPGGVETTQPFTVTGIITDPLVIYTDTLSSDATSTGNVITWSITSDDLDANGANFITRTFVVSVPTSLSNGTYLTNTYTIASPEVAPTQDSWSSSGVTVSQVTAAFTSTSPVCLGETMVFTSTGEGATSYEWNFGDGVTQMTASTVVSHPYARDGDFTVVLTVTGACDSAVTQATVTVNPLPMPTLQITPTTAMVCTTIYFTDTDTSDVVSRTWDFGDGEITTTIAMSTTSHSYAVPIDNYTVTLTSTTASGCISSTQGMITLTVGLPASISVIADPPDLPVGQASLLTAMVTDCGANPVADGTVITFTSSPDWSGVNPVTGTTSSGMATSTITGTIPGGTATVTATAPNLISGTTAVEFHVPELAISKEIQPATVVSSDTITYTLIYTNAGTAAAQGVCLTDTLPVGVRYGGRVSEDPTWPISYTVGLTQVTWCTPTLASGGSGTIVITATVNPTDVVSAIFTNTVEITTTTPESDVGNTYHASNRLSQTADVAISKVVTPTTLLPGDWLTYTLTFANVGYAKATGVVITDIYQPCILTNVSSISSGATVTPTAAAPPTYIWDVQDLSYGQGGVITITAQVTPSQTWAGSTILTNTAYITTVQPDGVGTNNTDQVTSTIQTADVEVSKEIQPPMAVSSDTITYTLIYTNAGAAVAQNVCLTDTLPAGVSYGGRVNGALDWPTYTVGLTQVIWCTPTLTSGANGTIVITATVDFTDVVSAIFTNTVEITTTTPESDASNNIDQDSNKLYQTADVAISKAVMPTTTLHPDDTITYTLTFTNQGQVVATGVVITDIYQPVSLTNVSSISSGAIVTPTAVAPPFYAWDVQGLIYGQGGVITITARVDPGQPWPSTPTTLTNTALITSTTMDGNAVNDSDQVTSAVVPGEPDTVSVTVSQLNPPICGTVLVTITVTDQWNNLISGEIVDLFVSCGTVAPNPVTTANGVATSTLTAIVTCTTQVIARARSNGQFGWSDSVNFGPPPIPTSISVTADPNTLPADGSSASIVTATVTDCTGPAKGVVVTFTISPAFGTFTPYTATTSASGIATSTLTAPMTPCLATVTATADSLAATTMVTFTGVGSISVTANPDTLPANGSSTSTVTARVTDTLGLPASGVVVTFTINPPLGTFPTTPYTATTDANGVATGTLTALVTPGLATVMATADSLVATTQVTFTAASMGGDVYLPIVIKNWNGTIPPSPNGDLIVTNIAFDPLPPVPDTAYHVTVTIQNAGPLTVTNDFWVDLYLNPPVIPTVNDIWCIYCPGGCSQPPGTCYGAAFSVTTDLAPGATLELHTSQVVDDEDYSNWPPPDFGSSHSPFYAQVDAWGFWYGNVYETDETNNIYCRNADGSICLSVSAVSSGVPSPGSRSSGSWGPRPTLPPRSEPVMTITLTPVPTSVPMATPPLPTFTPTPSPTPVPTIAPSAIPEKSTRERVGY